MRTAMYSAALAADIPDAQAARLRKPARALASTKVIPDLTAETTAEQSRRVRRQNAATDQANALAAIEREKVADAILSESVEHVTVWTRDGVHHHSTIFAKR